MVACSLALSWQAGTSIFSRMDWGRRVRICTYNQMTFMAVIIMVSNSGHCTITERSSLSCSVGQTILCVEVASSLETARRACQQRRLR